MPFNFPLSPPSASNFAPEYDAIFYLLLALTVFFTLIVGAGVIIFAVKYRKGSKADRSRPVYEDLRVELTLTIVPTILGLIMFYFGAHLFVSMRTPPKNAEEIFVVGKQWMWHIQHPNGVRENNTLHVPLNKPVKLTLISQDVIHAFYIPAFRTQVHVVPGRYTDMWFTPTLVGNYHLFCGMYCGTQHSEMGGTVVVMEPRKYAEWLANGGNSVSNMTMEQSGAKAFNRIGCNNCHGANDNLRAPSLVGIYGKVRKFADGTSLVADEAYLRESILNPYNHITAGYGPTMPAYAGQITEDEILNLLAYIKSIGMGTNVPASSLMASDNLATSSSGTNNPMAANALKYQYNSTDSTPTVRRGNLSVGAIAAQDKNP